MRRMGQQTDDPTLTLGQLRDRLNAFIAVYGLDMPVCVDTSYDQGCMGMGIKNVEWQGPNYNHQVPYIAIDA